MLEGILLGPEGAKWNEETRKMPEAYEAWVDAQIFSARATAMWDVYSDLIFPLENTLKRSVLDQFWTYTRKVRLCVYHMLPRWADNVFGWVHRITRTSVARRPTRCGTSTISRR